MFQELFCSLIIGSHLLQHTDVGVSGDDKAKREATFQWTAAFRAPRTYNAGDVDEPGGQGFVMA